MRNEKGQFIKGHKHTDEVNKKSFGYKHTEEALKKISEASKGRKPRLGMKNSEEWKKKFKEANSGSNNWHYKHGLSKTTEYRQIKENKRRSLMRSNGGNFTLEEWNKMKIKYKNTCLSCGRKEPDIKLTIDHIIPIFKGGMNICNNIQPLCISCNSRKHLKIIS